LLDIHIQNEDRGIKDECKDKIPHKEFAQYPRTQLHPGLSFTSNPAQSLRK
jgi:hypothetical protein